MQILMKKEDALKKFNNAHHLAQSLGITPSAVSQWGEFVPEPSCYRLLFLHPDIPHIQTDTKTEAVAHAS